MSTSSAVVLKDLLEEHREELVSVPKLFPGIHHIPLLGFLPDHEIRRTFCARIRPFLDYRAPEPGIISRGLSSCGYDFQLDSKFRACLGRHNECAVLDPLNLNPLGFDKEMDTKGLPYRIPPHGFVLAQSVEEIDMPDDVLVLAIGKSTYARLGLVVNVTPLENGWRGKVTIELSNTTGMDVLVYPNHGIFQALFFRTAVRPERTYADKKGIYDNQTEITLSKVRGKE